MDFRFLTGSSVENLKEWGSANRQNLAAGAFLTLGFSLGLGLGLLLNYGQPAGIIIDRNVKTVPASALIPKGEDYAAAEAGSLRAGNFSASISGAAYYPAGCASAGIIKEENRFWFETKEKA